MRPISRRQALLLGGLGVASTAAGGAGLLWIINGSDLVAGRDVPAGGGELAQPPEQRSSAGQLEVRLEAAPGLVALAGRQVSALGYNGSIPGPTLRIKAGDTLKIALANRLPQVTNLHLHGLHVSPEGKGDNVFVAVEPGASFDYEYKLPGDHPPGVYWYHPHHHGTVADQLFAGLCGAIIVEDPVPIDTSAERVLVITDTTVDALGNISAVSAMERMMGREGELVLVNGQITPHFSARPGQRERWRIINACVARFLRLRLDGQQLRLLGVDVGGQQPEDVDDVLLAPGNRADLLVTTTQGDAVLRAFPYNRGSMAGMMGRGPGPRTPQDTTGGIALATLRVSGEPAALPTEIQVQERLGDLRSAPVAARRQLVMATGMGMGMGAGMMGFTIDGRGFDESRTDTTVAAGSVEEWTIVNDSPMDHPFHLHVWPMQVIEEDGRETGPARWRDVVNVPANGRVKVRVAFRDFPGRSVYHCHILDHEDLGMMGVIEVR
ncbi:putative multicopper oxidase [Pseudarthrobacter phenanthrenivorans Sphe3]|uniref:Putative multicopper oxidase n=1 Tax=Pseudarthrobacter phenanthrenivorans (strain DSM 18606 / JCM 16027 / LMG 23796 / Sphe3) TaxID=930171 RepID=F0M1L7_PSEPM|nr:multicopper oxidase family protein [Pseudarthrobacter phenanthrenivorans]ADX74213.1 putative multicopper oxidase [Pseudarthrobacter phenanthrenivorans Sphe3]